MAFVAIMAASPDGRIAKYQDFLTEPEAEAHVAAFLGTYPDAFVVPQPSEELSNWLIDMTAKTLVIDPPPPFDFDAVDQAAVDALLLDSGVIRALAQALFQLNNRVRVLEGDSVITVAQFKTFLKNLIR